MNVDVNRAQTLAPNPSPRGRGEHKRRAFKLLMFLITGAIINVAVAWTFALWVSESSPNIIPDDEVQSLLSNEFVDHKFRLSFTFGSVGCGAGVARRVVAGLGFVAQGSEACAIHDYWVGFPCYAMSGRMATSAGEVKQSGVVVLNESTSRMLRTYSPPMLPISPLWAGFAINTMFYAAILWMTFVLPAALRRTRRLKRGLCPKCGYAVGPGGSPTCSECGAGVQQSAVKGAKHDRVARSVRSAGRQCSSHARPAGCCVSPVSSQYREIA